MKDPIKPSHYKIEIKGVECDYFDIGNALDLSLEQFTALRYFRKKGDVDKQIEDTKKCIECLKRHLEKLEKSKEK